MGALLWSAARWARRGDSPLLPAQRAATPARATPELRISAHDACTGRAGGGPGWSCAGFPFAGLFGRIASLAHRLVDVWEGDDGIVVSEDVSIWTLPDGQVIESRAAASSPCVTAASSPSTCTPTPARSIALSRGASPPRRPEIVST